MSDLSNWVFHYGENKTVWNNKDGDPWSIEERITKGGGIPTPSPPFPQGFEYLVNRFFELRNYCGDMDSPVTPALIDSLREYTSDIDCDIIFAMDKSFRAGAATAREYWKDH